MSEVDAVRQRRNLRSPPEIPHDDVRSGASGSRISKQHGSIPQYIWIIMAVVGFIGCGSVLLIPAGDLGSVSTTATGCPYMPDDSVAGLGWISLQKWWVQLQVMRNGERAYSLQELKTFDGTRAGAPILLACGGVVFDVSSGSHFYGPDAPYHVFAGRDGSKSLSTGSLEQKDVDEPDLSDFNGPETLEMLEQVEFYTGKYTRVGVLENWKPPPKRAYDEAQVLRLKRIQEAVDRKARREARKKSE